MEEDEISINNGAATDKAMDNEGERSRHDRMGRCLPGNVPNDA